MSQLNDKNRKKRKLSEDDDAGSAGGGKSGAIEFKEFIKSSESLRDDLLTGEEKRRLLSLHERQHEGVVKKQKSTREERQQLKEGKVNLQQFRAGQGNGTHSQYRSHPVLSAKAQFSGIDRQVSALPEENTADTNPEQRNELQHQYQLKYQPENTPRFNPKPIQR